jgi:DNA-binding transcriptional regulator YiaG
MVDFMSILLPPAYPMVKTIDNRQHSPYTERMDAQEFTSLRWELRMTQTELARRLRVHLSTVNRWEKGRRTIPYPVALAMRAMLAEQQKATA